jgi:hypothetical protein
MEYDGLLRYLQESSTNSYCEYLIKYNKIVFAFKQCDLCSVTLLRFATIYLYLQ